MIIQKVLVSPTPPKKQPEPGMQEKHSEVEILALDE
jgi:hypothetical protein